MAEKSCILYTSPIQASLHELLKSGADFFQHLFPFLHPMGRDFPTSEEDLLLLFIHELSKMSPTMLAQEGDDFATGFIGVAWTIDFKDSEQNPIYHGQSGIELLCLRAIKCWVLRVWMPGPMYGPEEFLAEMGVEGWSQEVSSLMQPKPLELKVFTKVSPRGSAHVSEHAWTLNYPYRELVRFRFLTAKTVKS